MKVLETEVDIMEQWDSPPRMKIVVDEIAPLDEVAIKYDIPGSDNSYYVWERYGENVILYSFVTGDKNKPGEGFGGGKYTAKLSDGTEDVLIGPFSGSPGFLEELGGPACLDVSVKETMGRFPDLWYGGISIDKESAEKLVEPLWYYISKAYKNRYYIGYIPFSVVCMNCGFGKGEFWIRNCRTKTKLCMCYDCATEELQQYAAINESKMVHVNAYGEAVISVENRKSHNISDLASEQINVVIF